MADIPPYPLYDRTYRLFRLSPLLTESGSLLSEHSLRVHAKRLRDQLTGDNVRGVQVDFTGAHDGLPYLGPLASCHWEVIGDEDAWIDRHGHATRSNVSHAYPVLPAAQVRGIEVSLEYENQSYTALLLRDPQNSASPPGFTALPLALVKMPAAIRDVFLSYLRTNFDSHIAPLHLSSSFIASAMENYMNRLYTVGGLHILQDAIRQIQVQLAFPDPSILCQSLDVTIATYDVPRFLSSGKLLKSSDRPFTTALAHYLRTHLALDLDHADVVVARIVCASLVLGTDRFKLAAPDASTDAATGDTGASAGQVAVHDLFMSFVQEATGDGRFLDEEVREASSSNSSISSSNQENRRKRAVSSASIPSNHKRVRARGKENRQERVESTSTVSREQ